MAWPVMAAQPRVNGVEVPPALNGVVTNFQHFGRTYFGGYNIFRSNPEQSTNTAGGAQWTMLAGTNDAYLELLTPGNGVAFLGPNNAGYGLQFRRKIGTTGGLVDVQDTNGLSAIKIEDDRTATLGSNLTVGGSGTYVGALFAPNITASNSLSLTGQTTSLTFDIRGALGSTTYRQRFNFSNDFGQNYSWQFNASTSAVSWQRQNGDTDFPLLLTRTGMKIGTAGQWMTNSGPITNAAAVVNGGPVTNVAVMVNQNGAIISSAASSVPLTIIPAPGSVSNMFQMLATNGTSPVLTINSNSTVLEWSSNGVSQLWISNNNGIVSLAVSNKICLAFNGGNGTVTIGGATVTTGGGITAPFGQNISVVNGGFLNGSGLMMAGTGNFIDWEAGSGPTRIYRGTTPGTNVFGQSQTTATGTILASNVIGGGVLISTNGLGTYSTNATLTVGTTGVTNSLNVNVVVYEFAGVSVTHTLVNGNSFSRGTISAGIDIVLKPGEKLTGTSCSASTNAIAF